LPDVRREEEKADMNWKRLSALLLLIVAVAIMAAGCGDDDDDGGDGGDTGQAAANIQVAPRDIGVVNLIRQSPAEDKIDDLFDQAGEVLGWNVEITDGQGDPAKIARTVQTYVNQGKDAIITTSTEAAIMRGALQDAQSQGIPVISTNGGTTKSDLFTAQYEEDEYKMGRQLAEYMKQTVENPQIANLGTSIAISGVLRDNAFHDVFPDSAFAAEQEVDLADPVGNTEKVLTNMLTANPDINAVHAVYDNMSQAAVTTLLRERSDALLFNYFTTAQNVENLRNDTALEAVSDVNLPHTGAVAFDQLLAFFERDQEIDPNALKKNPLTYEVVTRDNVDQLLGDKDELFTVDEILQPFIEKWQNEYGGGGGSQ
jgi:ABC-type sugar transport system substrate-binding protein